MASESPFASFLQGFQPGLNKAIDLKIRDTKRQQTQFTQERLKIQDKVFKAKADDLDALRDSAEKFGLNDIFNQKLKSIGGQRKRTLAVIQTQGGGDDVNMMQSLLAPLPKPLGGTDLDPVNPPIKKSQADNTLGQLMEGFKKSMQGQGQGNQAQQGAPQTLPPQTQTAGGANGPVTPPQGASEGGQNTSQGGQTNAQVNKEGQFFADSLTDLGFSTNEVNDSFSQGQQGQTPQPAQTGATGGKASPQMMGLLPADTDPKIRQKLSKMSDQQIIDMVSKDDPLTGRALEQDLQNEVDIFAIDQTPIGNKAFNRIQKNPATGSDQSQGTLLKFRTDNSARSARPAPIPTSGDEQNIFAGIKNNKTTTSFDDEGNVKFNFTPKTADELTREKVLRIEQAQGLSNDQKTNLFVQEGLAFPKNSPLARHFSARFKLANNKKFKQILRDSGSGRNNVLSKNARQQAEIEALNATANEFGRIPDDFKLSAGERLKHLDTKNIVDLTTGKLIGQQMRFTDSDFPGELFTKDITGQAAVSIQAQSLDAASSQSKLQGVAAQDRATRELEQIRQTQQFSKEFRSVVNKDPRALGASGDFSLFYRDLMLTTRNVGDAIMTEILGMPDGNFFGETRQARLATKSAMIVDYNNAVLTAFPPDGSVADSRAQVEFWETVLSFRMAKFLDPEGRLSNEDRIIAAKGLGVDRQIISAQTINRNLDMFDLVLDVAKGSRLRLLGLKNDEAPTSVKDIQNSQTTIKMKSAKQRLENARKRRGNK